MKIFICPICHKPQECSDKVGDTCKVYHKDCLDKELEPTRQILKATFDSLIKHQQQTVFDILRNK